MHCLRSFVVYQFVNLSAACAANLIDVLHFPHIGNKKGFFIDSDSKLGTRLERNVGHKNESDEGDPFAGIDLKMVSCCYKIRRLAATDRFYNSSTDLQNIMLHG